MNAYLDNLNRLNLALHCEVVDSDRHIDDVLLIEQSVFPELMQDSHATLKTFFSEKNAHGLVLYQNNIPVGAMKGHHICEECTDRALLESPDLRDLHDVTFYMDSIGVVKGVRSPHVLDFLIHAMSVDMRRFDYQFVAAHVRVVGGLSRLYQRRYKAKVLATYDNWANFGEPFDYILVDLKNVPIQSYSRQQVYRLIRKICASFKR